MNTPCAAFAGLYQFRINLIVVSSNHHHTKVYPPPPRHTPSRGEIWPIFLNFEGYRHYPSTTKIPPVPAGFAAGQPAVKRRASGAAESPNDSALRVGPNQPFHEVASRNNHHVTFSLISPMLKAALSTIYINRVL
jgi:hypothetical protein